MFHTQSNQPAAGHDGWAQQAKPLSKKPPPVLVYENVPLENRARPEITPNDPKWQEMLSYFNALLSDSIRPLDEILRNHFTQHEVRKFVPTIDEPFAKWQQEDSELFRRTLETRFKGVVPTLAVKITMLYFGLPVAPMKFGRNQAVTSAEVDDPVEEVFIEKDPLDFLNGYKERTYGLPPSEITYIPISIATSEHHDAEYDAESLGLRGGFLEDEDLEMIESESQSGEDVASQAQNSSAGMALGLRGGSGFMRSHRLYSRQGQADFACGYESLAQAVNQILSLDIIERKDLLLYFTLFSAATGRTEVTAVVDAPILPPSNGEEGPLSEVLAMIQEDDYVKTFVRMHADAAPSNYEPKPLDGGVATITMKDDDDQERLAYLRVPNRPSLDHGVVQYAKSYQQTIGALIGPQHQYISFNVPSSGVFTVYSCEDLPQEVIRNIATHPYCSIKAAAQPIDPNLVPVIVPDGEDREVPNAIELFRKDLGSVEGLERVVAHALSRQPGGGKAATAIRMHVWGEGFQELSVEGLYIELQDGKATQAGLNLWAQWVGGSKYDNPEGVSIVVQPWYDHYVLTLPQSMTAGSNYKTYKPVSVRLHECTLDLFKLKVSTEVYKVDYDPEDKEHTLMIEDETHSFRHMITHDSNNDDWQRILRRIMSQRIEITLRKGDQDAKWNDNDRYYWGPCYYQDHLNYRPAIPNPELTYATMSSSARSDTFTHADTLGSTKTSGSSRSQEIANNLYRTYSSRLNDFVDMKGTDNSMRDLTVWETPSIFTNPTKPVMPLHAPPLETVIRTGPDVPAITLGMRTATEQARLEREVHTLRAQLLDRIRDCPYNDCDKRFSYMDTHGFEKHIKYDHKILQCALCVAFRRGNGSDVDIDRSMMYMNRDQILIHISEEHSEQLKLFFQVPKEGSGSQAWKTATPEQKKKVEMTLFPYCFHCGRYEVRLDDPEDMFHHHINCRGTDDHPKAAAPFCKTCGLQTKRDGFGSVKCSAGSCGSHDPKHPGKKDCCPKCGFNLSGCSRAYRAKHQHLCRGLPGGSCKGSKSYCPFCGIHLADIDAEEQDQHIWTCRDRPQPKPQSCPVCPSKVTKNTLLYTPQEVQRHLETAHGSSSSCPWCAKNLVGKTHNQDWSDGAKHYHFAHHMGQVAPNVSADAGVDGHAPGSRCPYYHECGANTEDMNDKQWSRHMETNHAGHSFFPNGQPDPNATGPPAGYETGSLKDPRAHKPINRHVETNSSEGASAYSSHLPTATTTSFPVPSGDVVHNKKRPHFSGTPAAASSSSAKSVFDTKQWGTARLDEETDASVDESNKRRKVSFETDPTSSHHKTAMTEEPVDYTHIQNDLDQGQDLGETLPPQEANITERHQHLQRPQSFSAGHTPGHAHAAPHVEAVDEPWSPSVPRVGSNAPKAAAGTTAESASAWLFKDPIKPYANVPPVFPSPPPRANYGDDLPGGPTVPPRVYTTTSRAASGGRAAKSPAKLPPRSPAKSAPKSPAKSPAATGYPYGTSKTASPSGTVPPYSWPETGFETPVVAPTAAAIEEELDEDTHTEPYISHIQYLQPPASATTTTTTTSRYVATTAAEAGPGVPYISKVTPIVPPPASTTRSTTTTRTRHVATTAEESGPGVPYISKVTPIVPGSSLQLQHDGDGEPSPRTLTSVEEDVGTTTRSGRRTKPTAAKKASEAAAAKSPAKPATRARSAQVEESAAVPPPTPGAGRGASPAKRGRPRK